MSSDPRVPIEATDEGLFYDFPFVELKGGPMVPVEAYLTLLDLERRGVTVEASGAGLMVGPRKLLTEADRARVRKWKPHLLMLVNYQPPVPG